MGQTERLNRLYLCVCVDVPWSDLYSRPRSVRAAGGGTVATLAGDRDANARRRRSRLSSNGAIAPNLEARRAAADKLKELTERRKRREELPKEAQP